MIKFFLSIQSLWDVLKASPCSLLCVTFLINTLINFWWMDMGSGVTSEGFLLGGFSLLFINSSFMVFCVGIGSMVLWFSIYYIPKQDLNVFSIVIYQFILFMVYLTIGMNLMSMFLGWEGVGVISFLLIGWFSKREMAMSGGKQAVLFNRFTDFCFFVLILWEVGNGINFFEMSSSILTEELPIILMASLILSSAGKSAQFMFHPWLTSAMEGPTPVSSLLHSSTMVVAGVFLLILLHPYLFSFSGGNYLLWIISISSLLTLTSVSLWAFWQNDIKKIIALSTTSQLSFMMILICLNYVDLAFMHLILHGFFKALIFMGSGILIHNSPTSNQSITKVVSPTLHLFFITSFVIGNLGLMGMPFFGAFFSKHLFLSQLLSSSEEFSIFHWAMFCISMMLTAGYSIKTISLALTNKKVLVFPSSHWLLSEVLPLFVLSCLTLVGGPLIYTSMNSGEVMYMMASGESRSYLSLIILSGGLILYWSMNLPPKNFMFMSFFSTHLLMLGSTNIKVVMAEAFNSNMENSLLKNLFKTMSLGGISQSSKFAHSSKTHTLNSGGAIFWSMFLILSIVFLVTTL